MNDYNFGNFVCALREKNGMTQSDLAQQLGVTPAAVSKWENGSSKPRVEVLFQLAEILGVRPEELMAGHHLEEHLDSESVKIINKKYEYLIRIELHNTPKAKISRLIAAIIDWYIIGLIAIFAAALVIAFLPVNNPLPSYTVLPFILLFLVCVMFRDIIFGGRSLGKKLLGLTIIDMKTGSAPKKIALLLRNIFLFIVHVDCVVMLITGLTLGDRAAHTVVVKKKDLELSKNSDPLEHNVDMINNYASEQTLRTKSKRKHTIICSCIIVFMIIQFVVYIIFLCNL